MSEQNVVKHTHITHTDDVERAALATKQKFTELVSFPTQQTRQERQQ